ncbi:phosphotransferase family protein [Rhodococcus sp. HNM0569]|uniref:phosphotransferase n=1 Tax=Rhodococcus sp. HNM0569 TaxID=2716340 RepID=UPI00146C05ED|nr:phosphotransferase family protein [Rhodococcus sp. HNM0569]
MSTTPADREHYAEVARPSVSQRHPDDLRRRLEAWLATRTDAPVVTDVRLPDTNGMSSETVLFDARWDGTDHPLVARVAPAESTVPVFPSYDLNTQFRVMREVGARTSVPVPDVYWSEDDPEHLGAPFFVMARADGITPPDVMPYNFGSWVSEADDDARRDLQDASVRVLADLHAIADPATAFSFLPGADADATASQALARHVRAERDYYEWTTRTGPRSPLIERGFDWIDANMPDDTTPAVFSWGDARIGNIMYRDHRPVAVLDWEMATFGPREMDLAWMIFLHRFFEDLAETAGLDGLPDFLRLPDVATTYTEYTGHAPRNLEFHVAYAALRHATIMLRIHTRSVHFGQATAPADTDDAILHRASLEEMLAGDYWEKLR